MRGDIFPISSVMHVNIHARLHSCNTLTLTICEKFPLFRLTNIPTGYTKQVLIPRGEESQEMVADVSQSPKDDNEATTFKVSVEGFMLSQEQLKRHGNNSNFSLEL